MVVDKAFNIDNGRSGGVEVEVAIVGAGSVSDHFHGPEAALEVILDLFHFILTQLYNFILFVLFRMRKDAIEGR